ncbi:hypothetical protein ABLG96_01110 [Nakamurella sp. A5-74]|uniref:DUF222 domain-containing protein n=1 Tax=Nakamurella sp. A5-74 TaxID=3158264 RepID=A0AAU8DRR9_9ACTN
MSDAGLAALRLLVLAEQILDGTVDLGSRGPRVAAVMTRSAFEDWTTWMTALWCPVQIPGRPTQRSKLVVLRALQPPEVGASAARVWNDLSRACHRHAYELQPSAAEVQGLHAATVALMTQSVARPGLTGAPSQVERFVDLVWTA